MWRSYGGRYYRKPWKREDRQRNHTGWPSSVAGSQTERRRRDGRNLRTDFERRIRDDEPWESNRNVIIISRSDGSNRVCFNFPFVAVNSVFGHKPSRPLCLFFSLNFQVQFINRLYWDVSGTMYSYGPGCLNHYAEGSVYSSECTDEFTTTPSGMSRDRLR